VVRGVFYNVLQLPSPDVNVQFVAHNCNEYPVAEVDLSV